MKKKFMILGVLSLMMACTTACATEKPIEDIIENEVVVEEDNISEKIEQNEEIDSSASGEEKDMDILEETMKFDINNISSFDLTSGNLTDGIWDDVITNTNVGDNLSPELSWEPVEGANYYNIYMVDELAGNWLHWRVEGLTDAGLEAGVCDKEAENISNDSENEIMAQYVGPYPPGGTHTYTVYVFALKEMPDISELGDFDDSGNDVNDIAEKLNGDQNNLVGVGKLSGSYTAK